MILEYGRFFVNADILVFVHVYVRTIDRKIYATFYQDIIHGRDPVSFKQKEKRVKVRKCRRKLIEFVFLCKELKVNFIIQFTSSVFLDII